MRKTSFCCWIRRFIHKTPSFQTKNDVAKADALLRKIRYQLGFMDEEDGDWCLLSAASDRYRTRRIVYRSNRLLKDYFHRLKRCYCRPGVDTRTMIIISITNKQAAVLIQAFSVISHFTSIFLVIPPRRRNSSFSLSCLLQAHRQEQIPGIVQLFGSCFIKPSCPCSIILYEVSSTGSVSFC